MRPDRLTLPEEPTERRLSELVGWWLEIECVCQRMTYYPFRLMASQVPARTRLDKVRLPATRSAAGDSHQEELDTHAPD